MYIRYLEDNKDVFWKSCIRSIYTSCVQRVKIGPVKCFWQQKKRQLRDGKWRRRYLQLRLSWKLYEKFWIVRSWESSFNKLYILKNCETITTKKGHLSTNEMFVSKGQWVKNEALSILNIGKGENVKNSVRDCLYLSQAGITSGTGQYAFFFFISNVFFKSTSVVLNFLMSFKCCLIVPY